MKKYLALIICAFAACTCFSQAKKEERLYSAYLKDSVYYDVWLPENWDISQPAPVIYTFNYGMMDAGYIAAQLKYFASARYMFPKTIVVNVKAHMDRIGYNYETGLLVPDGEKFVRCIKEELIPGIHKKYNTAAFNVYMGHSYAASYANYLFLYHPGIFNGYVLFAPEKINVNQPPFNITDSLVNYYNTHTTFYYAAVGGNDMQRRKDYAREVGDKTKQFNNKKFFYKYDSIPGANHTNIITYAFEPAMEHIYMKYDPAAEDSGDTIATMLLAKDEERVRNAYNIGYEKSQQYYSPYAQYAINKKDTAGLLSIINHFYSPSLKAYDIRYFAQYCVNAGLVQKAKEYYMQAIGLLNGRDKNESWSRDVLINCYTDLALYVYKNDTAKAWQYLQKGIELSNKPSKNGALMIDNYFVAGSFAVDNNYNVKQGLQYLLTYLNLRKNVIDIIHYSYDRVYFYIGKSYCLLNDWKNAKSYIQKALDVNAGYKPAKDLMNTLN